MAKFSIASLQLELENKNNLRTLEKEIETTLIRFPWIDMIVLGELNAYGVNTKLAQPHNGEFETFFCSLAQKHKVWIIPGSYFQQDDATIYNTAPVISPDGEVIARHRKIYPFYPYEKGVTNGDEFIVFDVPDIGRFGVMICFDQWHPEVARTLAWMGAEVIVCPTLTNTIDRKVELALATANAAVNQCYFFNINAVGKLGYGQSIIVGPQGEVIYQANVGREIIPIQIDLAHVRDVRERGLHGLCQTLKSFRDHPIDFPVYRNRHDQGSLSNLGALAMPRSKLD